MFFEFSKIAGFLVSPVHMLLTMALLVSFWPQIGRRGWQFRVMQFFLAVLLAMLVVPLGNELLVPLETRFVAPSKLPQRVDGIIVLGGSVDEVFSGGQGHLHVNAEAERIMAPVSLLRQYPQARLVLTGGSGALHPAPQKESDKVRTFWRDAIVDRGQVLYEEASRNTYENALLTRDLVNPKASETWLLVTSAAHMPRAMGLFTKAGFQVVPYPVAFRSTGVAGQWYVPRTAEQALGNIEAAIHEYLGLWVYYQMGRIDDVFPAPKAP